MCHFGATHARVAPRTGIIKRRCEGAVMSKPNLPWWWSIGCGKRAPAPDSDYGDMGTAIGLDASFGPVEPLDTTPEVGDAEPSTDRLNRRSVI